MKRKIIYVLIAMLVIIIAAIAVISIQGVKVKDISFVENQDSDSFKVVLNIPMDSSRIELVKLEKDEDIWIGEHRHTIDDLDCSVLEILLYDTHISDELRKEVSESSEPKNASLDVVHLDDGLDYIITYPPDDSMIAIYLLIENRIVDMKGLNLEESHYFKELEINIGKECIDCFEPRFVSYTQNSYEPVQEFKMIKRKVIVESGSEEIFNEEVEDHGGYLYADWFGNINFTDEIKEGIISEVNKVTGIGHIKSRNVDDSIGFNGFSDVKPVEKLYIDYWFKGVETQGILEYSLLDTFNEVQHFKIPVSANLFTDSTDVYSKAWQEDNEEVDDESSYWDEQLDLFIDSLIYKDYDKFFELVGLRGYHLDQFDADDGSLKNVTSAYSFIEDFEIENYTIVDSHPGHFDGRKYMVELEVSESNTSYMPVGKSIWDVEVGIDEVSMVQLFKPHNEEVVVVRNLEDDSPAHFVNRAAAMLRLTETIDDFNTIVPDVDAENHLFDRFCIRMMKLLIGKFENEYITATDLEAEVEKVFGITEVDFTKHSHYIPETDSMSFGAGGGSWTYNNLVSEDFDEKSGVNTIVIDFYADAAYILKAKTMKYEVMDNREEGFKMLSSELIYDSGYEPLYGSI